MTSTSVHTFAPPAISARGLSKTFGSGETTVHALRNLDLDIERGRITAIMGRSGSGKSTLLQMLAGLDRPTSGSVRLGGDDITGLGDDELTRLRRTRMGFVFQAFNLLPALDARENIELPFRLAGRQIDLNTRGWIEQLIERLGLGPRLTHRPSELSGGQQQRVAIARALATHPDVVFADEPTGALDSATSTDVLDLLAALAREEGQTVVLVTHDDDAARRAERVVRLEDGRIEDDVLNPVAVGTQVRR
ncbi:MAG: hypothetical protein BGO38_14270 [Cellulomonas sp. 73-145]|uniref:ABC transporter ATP-binding protein n=1 Tax=Cellulomonas sp. 73-145 TaxID=1895739 RepID=UPI00092BDC5D|nr:ABC transporter ATP-binding protein [Cellulomonas sp. 73-145]OJV58589.1 MAG: hypothetical protein BGO38_14270 [Cellulomonas sp. 73-145]